MKPAASVANPDSLSQDGAAASVAHSNVSNATDEPSSQRTNPG